MPKGCWKTGTGYRRKIWINAANVQMIPVWAQTVLLVSDNLRGTGRRWNRKPGSTCLLAHGMVWLAGDLQCRAEGALLSGYWQQISYMKQNLMDGWIFWLEKAQPYSWLLFLPCKFYSCKQSSSVQFLWDQVCKAGSGRSLFTVDFQRGCRPCRVTDLISQGVKSKLVQLLPPSCVVTIRAGLCF